ncbi:ABC transporter ATP-binding protein [Inconstantimicrobium mannanitabidum]|uniref:Peptide ABC transporter ATP-binding protein n=1 Tax=Inconstantimicrobium mannanitabidum TaxID=1604901 RepID=A0ACB5RF88_9CLOT|nr:ABC transporter ATP-binding protein [Clostridium sp. TW13]GKX67659.1 peptide ABC transporter ATP-binding protein [Clostridium sp. TW13]
MKILECEKLTKVYDAFKGAQPVRALDNVSFTVQEGEFIGIMGPSGSGKTTLLNILSGLDNGTSGNIFINNKNILKLKKDDLALFRRRNLGFIFQDFNLLDSLTIRENIGFPLTVDKISPRLIDDKVDDLVDFLELNDIENSYPYIVSGGQKQRTAVARALVGEPKIIFADEPTGNLDSKSSKNIMTVFTKINKERKATILMVTHDPFAASFCKKIIFIKDGQIEFEINSSGNRKEFFDKIIDSQTAIGGKY